MKPPAPSLPQRNHLPRLRTMAGRSIEDRVTQPLGFLILQDHFLAQATGRRAALKLKRDDFARSRNNSFIELVQFRRLETMHASHGPYGRRHCGRWRWGFLRLRLSVGLELARSESYTWCKVFGESNRVWSM